MPSSADELPRVEHIGKLRYIEQVLMETLRTVADRAGVSAEGARGHR
jgi:hypothetical protein